MSIDPTSALGLGGFTPTQFASGATGASGTSGVDAGAATRGADFGKLMAEGVDKLEATQDNADNLAVRAASGNLNDIHDYTLAASEAQVATQLTVALRNKAIESFTEIMRMNV